MDFYQWTAVAVIVALAAGVWRLLIAILRRLPPFAAAPGPAGAWDAQYRSDWQRGLGDGLLAGAVATVLAAIALATAASAAAPASEVRLAPHLLLWLVPGALLAWPVALAVWSRRRVRALPPDRLHAVLAARELHDRLRPRPLAWLKGGLASAAGLVAALLLADWNLQVTPGTLTWDPLWTLQSRSYAYADVRSVEALQSRRAWHGEIVRQPAYRIALADGRAWESWRASHGKTPAALEQTVRLIAQRSGRPVETLDPYPRGVPADPARAARNTNASS
jgi:hypothetical protein